MLTIEQQLSHHLGLFDQAAREGRACRVTLHKGKPVVEMSPEGSLRKQAWKLSHRRNSAGEKKLRDMVIDVIGDPTISLSLKKQIVEGARAQRYPFFSKSDTRTIVANEALLLAPAQRKAPPKKPLSKRRIALVDAMKSNGPEKVLAAKFSRSWLPDAMKNSKPAIVLEKKALEKEEHRERPSIPFTPSNNHSNTP